jgi:hypothetical protein
MNLEYALCVCSVVKFQLVEAHLITVQRIENYTEARLRLMCCFCFVCLNLRIFEFHDYRRISAAAA